MKVSWRLAIRSRLGDCLLRTHAYFPTYAGLHLQSGATQQVAGRRHRELSDRSVAIRQIEQRNCTPIRIEPVGASRHLPGPTARAFIPKVLTGPASEIDNFSPQSLKSAQSVARLRNSSRIYYKPA